MDFLDLGLDVLNGVVFGLVNSHNSVPKHFPSGCCSQTECDHPKLLASENQTLLIWRAAFLVLDLGIDVIIEELQLLTGRRGLQHHIIIS